MALKQKKAMGDDMFFGFVVAVVFLLVGVVALVYLNKGSL